MSVCGGFHGICGMNIVVRDSYVEWKSVASGGLFFSCRPLRNGEVTELSIEDGSGHLDLGCIQNDPSSCSEKLMSPQSLNCFLSIKAIKVHKKKITMKIQLSKNGDYLDVWADRTDEAIKTDINKTRETYIAVYIKFGGVAVSFPYAGPSQIPIRFHDVCGPNVSFDAEKRVARLQNHNPMTLCSLKRPLSGGDSVRLQIEPLKTNDLAPRLYHIHILCHNAGPEELLRKNPQSFNLLGNSTSPDNWTKILTLEKGDISDIGCQIRIEVSSKYIKHTFLSNGKSFATPLSNFKNKIIWIYFELYRVRLVLKYSDIQDDGNYHSPDIDVNHEDVQGKSELQITEAIVTRSSNDQQKVTDPDHFQQVESDNRMLKNRVAELEKRLSENRDIPDGRPSNSSTTVTETPSHDAETTVSLSKNIQKKYTYLKGNLIVKEIVDIFFESEYLSGAEHEKIKKSTTENDKTEELLTILRKRPIRPSLMKKALMETNHEFLIGIFFGE